MKDTLRQGDRGADIRVLQTALNSLGANLVVDGVFGEKTAEAVRGFQQNVDLVEDGVVGPKTWKAIEMAQARAAYEASLPPLPPLPPARKTDDDLKAAGERAVERALTAWARDIYDPKTTDKSKAADTSRANITAMIHEGLGWTWEPSYAGDGDFEWCGAFASMCWDRIKPSVRKLYFASTYRLDRYASYRTVFGEAPDAQPDDGSRIRDVVDGDEGTEVVGVRPGDILLVGRRSYGSHICLVESYDPETGVFNTIEGNAYGFGPNGEHQQGVVKHQRTLEEVRRVIRPGVDDLL